MPLKVHRRGKVWHYSGTVSGRRLRGSTGTTDKKTAQRIASDVEQKVWQRRLDGPGQNLTMAQAFTEYLNAGKSDRFIEPLSHYFRDTPVAHITAGMIKQAAIQLYPNAQASTRNRHVIVPVQAAINHCAELDWCSPIKVRRFKVETKPKSFVTEEWVGAFERHASPHMGALCRFMFETGARVGEAVALTWADVDLNECTARIRQTKINDERDANLTTNIVVDLSNLPSNRREKDRVFGFAGRDSVPQTWRKVIRRAGIERMTPHACRHGFATAMLRAGVDVKTVARWGGWKDVRVLLETYAHAIDDPQVVNDVFGTKLTQRENQNALTISNKRRKR